MGNSTEVVICGFARTPIGKYRGALRNYSAIELGIMTAFIISTSWNSAEQKKQEVPNPQYKKYDFGVCAGINYYLSDNIILNTRISNSILPIRPHVSEATKGWNKGQYNTVLSFTINYILI